MVACRRLLAFVVLAVVACAQQAPPQAPPARDFGRQLWTNTKGLFSTNNLVPLVAGTTVAGTSAVFDHRVQDYFGGERRAPWIGSAGNIIGNAVTLGSISGVLLYTSYHKQNQRFRAMSFDLAQGLVIDGVTSAAIKAIVRRDRPDESNHYSFPSGHASATTTAATVISYYYPKATIPAYLVAGFVGFSRIEKNRHWLSDVVAGTVQGVIIGRTVVRDRSIFRAGRFEWYPNISTRGIAVNASIRLGRAPAAAAE